MITTTYALDCFRWNCFLRNVDCKIEFPEWKIYHTLYIEYIRLLNICQSFLSIIFAFSILFLMLFSYVSSSPEVLFHRRASPSPKVLSLTRSSYLSGQLVAKYKLTSQRALADFARGVFATPLWTPGFWIPGTVSLFDLGLQSHVPAMPTVCPYYAHAMPISCTILWAWLY